MSSDEKLKEIAERIITVDVVWQAGDCSASQCFSGADFRAALQQAREQGREEERKALREMPELCRIDYAADSQAGGYNACVDAVLAALDARSSHQGQCQGEQCLPNCSCACHARPSQGSEKP